MLFADEFDEALSLPHKDDLLDALCLTRNVEFLNQNALYTFVGVGTYGMIDLVTPISQSEDVHMEDAEAAKATEAAEVAETAEATKATKGANARAAKATDAATAVSISWYNFFIYLLIYS